MSPEPQTSQQGASVHPRSDYLVLLLGVPRRPVSRVGGPWGCCGLVSWGCPGPSGSLDLFFLPSGTVVECQPGVEHHPLQKQKEKKYE